MPIEKPLMTFDQLREQNEDAYQEVMGMIFIFAKHLYDKEDKFRSQGLEAVMEYVTKHCDKGLLKISVNQDGSQWQMGVYDENADGYVAYQG